MVCNIFKKYWHSGSAWAACLGMLLAGTNSRTLAQANATETTSITTSSTTSQSRTNVSITVQNQAPITFTLSPTFHITTFALIENKIVLTVRLNAKLSANMILDTGANTCLLPQAAASLGLKLKADPDGRPKSRYGAIAALTIDNVPLQNVPVEVKPLSILENWNKAHPQAQVVGILGLDAIEDWAVGLDFVSHTMGWWEGGKLLPEAARGFNYLVNRPEDAPGAIRVVVPGSSTPLKNTVLLNSDPATGVLTFVSGSAPPLNNTVFLNPALAAEMPCALPLYKQQDLPYYFLKANLDAVPVEMALDTGSDGLSVSETTAAKVHPLFHTANVAKAQGDDYEANASTTIVRSLTLASVPFDFPTVTIIHPRKETGKSALSHLDILGMEALANCRVIMDFPGKTLYLSPYANYNRTPKRTLRRLGIVGQHVNDQYTIYALLAGYPAVQLGLKVKDELLDINGVPFAKWLASAEGVTQDPLLTLHVRRAGSPEPLTFSMSIESADEVRVVTVPEPNMLPKEWLSSVTFTALDPREVPKVTNVIDTASHKYPAGFLSKHLSNIYVLGSLKIAGEIMGGVAGFTTRSIYVVASGTESDFDLESELHHETAHLLAANLPKSVVESWMACNPPDFKYGVNGIEAVKAHHASEELDKAYFMSGFVCQYATAALEEDIAEVYQNLFMDSLEFWLAVQRSPALKKKVEIAIAFYHSLDARFTQDSFTALHHGPPTITLFRGGGTYYPLGGPPIPIPVGGELLMYPDGAYNVRKPAAK